MVDIRPGEEHPQEFGVTGVSTSNSYVLVAPLAQALVNPTFIMAGIAFTRKLASLRCVW